MADSLVNADAAQLVAEAEAAAARIGAVRQAIARVVFGQERVEHQGASVTMSDIRIG